MPDFSKSELKEEVFEILKDADLSVISAKKVRQQLEAKFKCKLKDRMVEIDEFALSYINAHANKADKSDEKDEDEEEENKTLKSEPDVESEDERPKKRAAKKNYTENKKKVDPPHESSESEEESEDERPRKRSAAVRKVTPKKRKTEPKKKGAKKTTGFTRPYNLSPDLASLVGADTLARHEVVKKVWAIIKERNLYDPKNKQFAICDPELHKIMGVKRFRTFGMLKYLKSHFLD